MSGKEKLESNSQSKKADLGLLEEDDDFEEFPAEGERIYRRFSMHISGRMDAC